MMMHVCTQATNNSKPPFWLVDRRLDCCTSSSSRSEQSNDGYASRARVHTTYAIMNNNKGILVHRVRTEPHQQNVADAVCSPSALANAAAARLTTATIRVVMPRCSDANDTTLPPDETMSERENRERGNDRLMYCSRYRLASPYTL